MTPPHYYKQEPAVHVDAGVDGTTGYIPVNIFSHIIISSSILPETRVILWFRSSWPWYSKQTTFCPSSKWSRPRKSSPWQRAWRPPNGGALWPKVTWSMSKEKTHKHRHHQAAFRCTSNLSGVPSHSIIYPLPPPPGFQDTLHGACALEAAPSGYLCHYTTLSPSDRSTGDVMDAQCLRHMCGPDDLLMNE